MLNKRIILIICCLALLFGVMITIQNARADTVIVLDSPIDSGKTNDTTPDFIFTPDSNSSLTITSCTLFVDDTQSGTTEDITNATQTTITSNTTLSVANHSWYVNCTDIEGTTQSVSRTLRVYDTYCAGANYQFICGDTINESCNFNSNISVNGSSCFDVSGNDITIDLNGYTLNGNRANLTKGFNASGNSNLTIINGKINQFYAGIYFDSVSDSNFSNLYFENNMRNAIYAQNSVSNVFEDLYIVNTSATCQYQGGSHCQYDREEGESGLSICTGSGNNITNYTFYGDDLSNDSTECGTDSGLDLFAATNNELDYIYLYYSDTYGIMIQDVSPGTHINHYFAYGANSINKNMNDAIIQSDGSDGTIINNSYMEKMIEWGPFMNNAHDVIMNNLTIFDVNRIAIRMTTSSNNITIQNCNITNGAPEGAVYLPDATDINLINNTLYNTTAISFSTGYNVYAENNVYQDSDGFQAYLGSNYTSKNELFNNSGAFNVYGVDVTILDSTFLNTSITVNQYSTIWSNVYLINSSYNVSKLSSSQGTIYVGTYANILVYNHTGDAIENANFTEYDNNSIVRVSALTNSTGEISNYAYGFLIDENHSEPYYLNNYSMNVTHTSYLVSSQTVNVTESIENSPNFVNLTYNLTYDDVSPQIGFSSPTPDDGETLTVNYFNISIEITEDNFLNSTIYLYYDNGTLLSETQGNIGAYNLHNGLYYYNATAYDYNENYNYTETRNITISSSVCQGDTTAFICGETVTESCNLTGDISGIGGITCLAFGADAIIIDGFGYSIIGDGTTIGLNLGGNYGTVQNITLNNHSIGLSTSSSNNVLDHIIVNNSQNRGIHLEYGDTNLINNSWIDNSLNTGIYINSQSSSGGTIVQNSNITNNGLNVTDLDKYGIYSTSHSNLNITNNIFNGNYIGYLSTTDNPVELSGNLIANSINADVWIEGSTAISLLNNNISGSIYGVNSLCQTCVFTGNNVSNNDYNLFVRATDSSWLSYTIDDTNSFDGKLVRIYTSQSDLEANTTNTAMIISSYCTNFNVTNTNFNSNNSHAIIIGDGTNILIKNNTMTNSYYGIETVGSHIDFVMDNNTFARTQIGVYYTSNINITNNNFSQNNYGLYSTSDGGNVLNNSFNLNNNSLYFYGAGNQIVADSHFSNSNISIFLINSADTSTFTNSLMNNNLIDLKFEGYDETTGGGGGASPPKIGKPPVTPNAVIYHYPSDNNFISTPFTSNLTINSWTKTNNLINSTFNQTLYSTIHDGILSIRWYLDVYVNNSDGTPADGAEVIGYDNLDTLLFDLTTNSSGYIDRQTLTEYLYDNTGATYYTPFLINATNTTLNVQKQLNLTTNYLNKEFFITLTNDTPPVISDVELNSTYYDKSISCLGTYSDAENEAESGSTYRWFKNGVLSIQTTKVIAPDTFSSGDMIICEYTPCDNSACGTAVNSSATEVTHTHRDTAGGNSGGIGSGATESILTAFRKCFDKIENQQIIIEPADRDKETTGIDEIFFFYNGTAEDPCIVLSGITMGNQTFNEINYSAGNTYKIFEIETELLNKDKIGEITLQIAILNEWLDMRDNQTLRLVKNSEFKQGGWQIINLQFVKRDGTYSYFTARLSNLSVFLIMADLKKEFVNVCGNDICDSGETAENCCVDCGCAEGLECKNDTCKKITQTGFPIWAIAVISGIIAIIFALVLINILRKKKRRYY